MIAELIERLEKAEGPDREIDADLVCVCCPGALVSQYIASDAEPSVFHAHALGLSDRSDVPAYTSSLDAALSLVERRGWRPYTLDASIKGRFSWMLASQDQRALTDDEGREYMGTAYASGVHSTPALAVCLALLRALSTEA